jgi:[protein-PII] uridylyltransferase
MSSFVAPADAALRGKAAREWCLDGRSAWRQRHQDGTPATHVARGLADMMEQMVVGLFARAAEALPLGHPGVALVALGSLGRREMCPYSDLDLIVVSEAPKSDAVRAVADGLFYPLWDARLEVGHAVRSPEDFARLTVEDDTVRTGAVDWRALAGEPDLLTTLHLKLRQALGSGATRRYAADSVREWTQGRNPATVYHLQPDIKTGPGGLREIHRLWWLARLLWKIDAWRDFLALGLVDKHGLETLAMGRETLLNIRLAMHFVAGRRQDQLRFDLQDEVANYLQVQAGPAPRAPGDNLLEIFYRHAKAVRGVSTRVLERCAESLLAKAQKPSTRPVDGFDLFAGRLTVQRPDQLEREPLDVLRIFRVAQQRGVRLYVHARAKIAEAAPRLLDESLRTNRDAARLFLDIVSDARDAGESLELLHELGVLDRFMPEFQGVTGLAQRDMYHVHTVDAHLVACARAALLLLGGQDAAAPADMQQLAARVARPHVLVLAALMHDIGKGHGHGHSERGAAMAKAACTRLFLSDEDVADVTFLVLEHLSMFKISQRRDLEDEQLVARFARAVGTLERLDLLMLLSYADATTTGPEAWTEWKAQLLRELYNRTRRALKGAVGTETLATQAASRLEEVRVLAPERDAAMRALAARLVPRHLLVHRATLLLRHLQAVERVAAEGACCTAAPDERRGSWEIVVVGPDRPGLLADLSGVLAAWGVSVDAAYISGTTDNLVIDTFTVRGGASTLFEKPARLELMLHELRQATLTQVDYGGRIEERRRAQAMRASGLPRPETRIVYDLESPAQATVVDVFAADRVAFLHDVTKAIFRAGASIRLARVTTEGERAVDAFYLVNATTGQPLTERERDTVERAIRQAAAAS